MLASNPNGPNGPDADPRAQQPLVGPNGPAGNAEAPHPMNPNGPNGPNAAPQAQQPLVGPNGPAGNAAMNPNGLNGPNAAPQAQQPLVGPNGPAGNAAMNPNGPNGPDADPQAQQPLVGPNDFAGNAEAPHPMNANGPNGPNAAPQAQQPIVGSSGSAATPTGPSLLTGPFSAPMPSTADDDEKNPSGTARNMDDLTHPQDQELADTFDAAKEQQRLDSVGATKMQQVLDAYGPQAVFSHAPIDPLGNATSGIQIFYPSDSADPSVCTTPTPDGRGLPDLVDRLKTTNFQYQRFLNQLDSLQQLSLDQQYYHLLDELGVPHDTAVQEEKKLNEFLEQHQHIDAQPIPADVVASSSVPPMTPVTSTSDSVPSATACDAVPAHDTPQVLPATQAVSAPHVPASSGAATTPAATFKGHTMANWGSFRFRLKLAHILLQEFHRRQCDLNTPFGRFLYSLIVTLTYSPFENSNFIKPVFRLEDVYDGSKLTEAMPVFNSLRATRHNYAAHNHQSLSVTQMVSPENLFVLHVDMQSAFKIALAAFRQNHATASVDIKIGHWDRPHMSNEERKAAQINMLDELAAKPLMPSPTQVAPVCSLEDIRKLLPKLQTQLALKADADKATRYTALVWEQCLQFHFAVVVENQFSRDKRRLRQFRQQEPLMLRVQQIRQFPAHNGQWICRADPADGFLSLPAYDNLFQFFLTVDEWNILLERCAQLQ